MRTLICALLALVFCGCGGEGLGSDRARVAELRAMPVLWESKIVVADPEMPDMRKIVPMYDSHDPSLMKAWEKDRFTEDYIPEEVMAFVSDRYRNKPRAVTLRMGDRVSVLAKKRNNTKREVCLVRTSDDTYAWLYTFTLLDQAGNRMGKLE